MCFTSKYFGQNRRDIRYADKKGGTISMAWNNTSMPTGTSCGISIGHTTWTSTRWIANIIAQRPVARHCIEASGGVYLSFLFFPACGSEVIIRRLNLGKSSSILHSGMPSHHAKVLGATWPEIMYCLTWSSVYGPCCCSLTKSNIPLDSSCPVIFNAVNALWGFYLLSKASCDQIHVKKSIS